MLANENTVLEHQQAVYKLNETQHIRAIGLDTATEPTPEPPEGSTIFCMGRLDDIGFIMQSRLANSLQSDGWDWQDCPNPWVFIEEKGGVEE